MDMDFSNRMNITVQLPALTNDRVKETLKSLDITILDHDDHFISVWDRFVVLFAVEGPDDDILVIRSRLHEVIIPEFSDRVSMAVNEWNLTRRFTKAYLDDQDDEGQVAIYTEMQIPLGFGVTDEQLFELIDCGIVVSQQFTDWIYDEEMVL